MKIILSILALTAIAQASTITLKWDHNKLGEHVNYDLFKGIEKIVTTPDLSITVEANEGDVFHVIAVYPMWRSEPSNFLTITWQDLPIKNLVVVTETSDDLITWQEIFHVPLIDPNKPRRFIRSYIKEYP